MRRQISIFLILILMLAAPLLVGVVINDGPLAISLRQILVTLSFLLIPLIVFRRSVSLYFWLLLPLAVLSPMFICSIIFFRLFPGLEMIAVIMQSNSREAQEAVGGLLWFFIPFTILYVSLYVVLTVEVRGLSFATRPMIIVSMFAFFVAFGTIYFEKELYYKPIWRLNRYDLLKTYHYPLSLLGAATDARAILKKNKLRADDFSFGARSVGADKVRHLFVLVIGEASRFDHWQVNGYPRATSPLLSKRKNLISFDDVVAGSHYTWIAVPQLITRATPQDIERQFREKSVVVAFKEAGYATAWISNQSDKEIFWTGSIVLHANTADFATFSPTYSPNFEFEDVYDDRVLPIIDSLVNSDAENRFIVVHLSGQHWDYSRRYPGKFDHFLPSGKTVSINPPQAKAKEATINSYDNSIRYTDAIVDSIISMLNKKKTASFLLFISDHGEDLFDADPDQLDFHFHPSKQTLHVPLFIWTSDHYKALYPETCAALIDHRQARAGAKNIFYTLVNAGAITYPGFDSTQSLASLHFVPTERYYLGDDKRAVEYDSEFAANNIQTRNQP